MIKLMCKVQKKNAINKRRAKESPGKNFTEIHNWGQNRSHGDQEAGAGDAEVSDEPTKSGGGPQDLIHRSDRIIKNRWAGKWNENRQRQDVDSINYKVKQEMSKPKSQPCDTILYRYIHNLAAFTRAEAEEFWSLVSSMGQALVTLCPALPIMQLYVISLIWILGERHLSNSSRWLSVKNFEDSSPSRERCDELCAAGTRSTWAAVWGKIIGKLEHQPAACTALLPFLSELKPSLCCKSAFLSTWLITCYVSWCLCHMANITIHYAAFSLQN